MLRIALTEHMGNKEILMKMETVEIFEMHYEEKRLGKINTHRAY